MTDDEFYSCNIKNINTIFYKCRWICFQGLGFHSVNFEGLYFWTDILQKQSLSVLIFYLHHILMAGFIVLIYNFNRNFVKCTSGGFDPDILWSLISALDHSSTLPTYFNRVKKSIMFQSLALLSSSMKSVDKSCTFTYFYWVNLKVLTILFDIVKVHIRLEYLMNSKRTW